MRAAFLAAFVTVATFATPASGVEDGRCLLSELPSTAPVASASLAGPGPAEATVVAPPFASKVLHVRLWLQEAVPNTEVEVYDLDYTVRQTNDTTPAAAWTFSSEEDHVSASIRATREYCFRVDSNVGWTFKEASVRLATALSANATLDLWTS